MIIATQLQQPHQQDTERLRYGYTGSLHDRDPIEHTKKSNWFVAPESSDWKCRSSSGRELRSYEPQEAQPHHYLDMYDVRKAYGKTR